ncbi:MAG: hypothetical protein GX483_04530 [Actinomycetaceae bacterium]|nr:hypothetical protein [Actinomycetaceae bacterium]
MIAKTRSASVAILLTLALIWSFSPVTAYAAWDRADVTDVYYGSNPSNYEIFPYTTYLDQVTTRSDYMSATRALRGDMWDRNVPFNGMTLRQAAAKEGIYTRSDYVYGFVWDASIERIAVQRAVETRVHGQIAHKRTVSGDSVWSATYWNQRAHSEIIAWGYSSMYTAVYNGWGHGEVNALIAANGWFNSANGHLHALIDPGLKYHGAAAVGNVDLGMAARNLVYSPNQAGTGWQGTYTLSYAVDRSSLSGYANSWYKDSLGNWYYINPGGYKATGWKYAGGTWYLLDSWYGNMAVGWKKTGSYWYYFDSSGAMKTGWQKVNGTWYYMLNWGAMATNWQHVGGNWYYFDSSGAMKTGWVKPGNTWYYLQPGSGQMITGMHTLNDATYYFDNYGGMATGWRYVDNDWYYFDTSGAMHRGWLQLGDMTYYFDLDGKMVTGTQTIDEVEHSFDLSGALV